MYRHKTNNKIWSGYDHQDEYSVNGIPYLGKPSLTHPLIPFSNTTFLIRESFHKMLYTTAAVPLTNPKITISYSLYLKYFVQTKTHSAYTRRCRGKNQN